MDTLPMALGQSLTLPFLCAECHSLYDTPEKLILCLQRHAEARRRFEGAEAAKELTP